MQIPRLPGRETRDLDKDTVLDLDRHGKIYASTIEHVSRIVVEIADRIGR
jgi:uncharacterized protein YuzE